MSDLRPLVLNTQERLIPSLVSPVTSLPSTNPTISYWQSPPSQLADVRSTPGLPHCTSTVIIGSGITGVSIAHKLLQRDPSANVLMLEARQACSGATGRNGKNRLRHLSHSVNVTTNSLRIMQAATADRDGTYSSRPIAVHMANCKPLSLPVSKSRPSAMYMLSSRQSVSTATSAS